MPTPRQAARALNAPCTRFERTGLVWPCAFGVPAEQARGTIALVGDSHASHWRAALEVVAQAKRWRGISIARTSCPLSTAPATGLTGPERADCVRWNRAVPQFLARHREVDTVFVSALSPRTAWSGPFAPRVAGYIAAWKRLPDSVRHIVVIRDTPVILIGTLACVMRAKAAGERPATACAVPRAAALKPDPAVAAAAALRSRRVQVIDLTRFFCDRRLCYPVVGGVLVYKDTTHLTSVFATTLGPFLLREVARLSASW